MSANIQKTAILIGGSRGLGAELALQAVHGGYHVVLIGKNKKALIATDDRVRKAGGSATLVPFDLRNVNLLDQLAVSLASRFPHFDKLIFNAAYLTELRPISHTTNEQWDDVIAANLTAPMRLLRALDPLIRKNNKADILFITDRFEGRPTAYWGAYATSKAGLDRLAEIYKAEIAPCSGVKVYNLDPGPMATELRKKAFPGEDTRHLKTPAESAHHIWETVLTGSRPLAA